MVELQGQDGNDGEQPLSDADSLTLEKLKEENRELKERYIAILGIYLPSSHSISCFFVRLY